MTYGSIVSIFDRLSIKTVLTNYTGSYIGFAATLALIAVCLVVLIPPVNQYFNGVYFESQIIANKFPKNTYTTGTDIILALVFKNKLTNQLANHAQILQNLNSQGWYYGKSQNYKVDLKPCNTALFQDAVNPQNLKECIMLPQNLNYDASMVEGYMPTVELFFSMKCNDPFKCISNSAYMNASSQYIQNISTNYYFEFIFNSKVLDDKGRQTNLFHKIYSTEYQSPDGFSSWVGVDAAQKTYFIDDSILPWWNNRTYENVYWTGSSYGVDVSQGYVVNDGFLADYAISRQYSYSYRYYKKLDFLLGMIGGTVFLIFLFFWIPFTYINRTLQKIKNAEQLLIGKDQFITTEQNLHKIKIPFYYLVTKWLPGNKTNQIIEEAQQQIDIVRLIKKMKVTHRNLRTQGLDLTFKTKDVDLDSVEPDEYIPDRPVLQSLQITLDAYQAISQSNNTARVYQNNITALAILPNSSQKIDQLMKDQNFEKNKSHHRLNNWKQKVAYVFKQVIRFFDIFGARPTLNAEPQTSSFWGFFLTLVIITLSVLTFALTIKNMDSVKIISSFKYENPMEHTYQMTTSKNFRFAFCFDSYAANKYLTGATKTVQLTMFRNSKKFGLQKMDYQKMIEGQFATYFDLDIQNPYVTVPSQNCFRPSDNQKVRMAGSHESINEAYFGARLDPYCSGTPSQCIARKNQTITNFVNFINYRSFGIYLSQNKYSPDEGRIISGIAGQEVSQTDYVLNASLMRTETKYVSAIQLLDDSSKSFLRKDPKVLQRTMVYSDYGDRNQQKKGDPNADPAYILQFRPNGQVNSIILRSYKIDFLFGIIGGCFLFWYFFVSFFAKIYNSYKVRAKLAEVLHREDGYDESVFVHFLYMTKIPSFVFCCSQLKQDLGRIEAVDGKMERDLNYLNLIKNVDNCYRLSSCLFRTVVEKDLSLIYFRQKIDQSQLVKPKRISELKQEQFQDDQFLQFDDQYGNNGLANAPLNATQNLVPEMSVALNNNDLQKIINMGQKSEKVPLYDPFIPYKKQSNVTRIMKKLDVFKNPPELTLDGERDVKSILGGIIFFIIAALIIIVVVHFLDIYSKGKDYTVSHRRIIDGDVSSVDVTSTLGDLSPGVNVISGKNFKFAVTFNKKDQYYPFNVSQYIGPIGIRMMQYTVSKFNNQVTEVFDQIELEPCSDNYFQGFLGPYNDGAAFKNISLGYCLPDGKMLSLGGTPQDPVRKYFKVSIYNKFGNVTGKSVLNSFFKVYLVEYYMSVPRMDIFQKQFTYDMVKFDYYTDPYSFPIERNLTFSKVVFTDKYYSRSRQTYNDKTIRSNERQDVNTLSEQNTRNLTFYYDGMIDHYTLDYPGVGQLFGLVGGVIAMFVWILYSLITSFNEYRMKYLIGQRLYTFDKKLSGLSKEKGKKINIRKIQQATRKINNFNQLELILCWILNPIGYIRDNYNFNKTLRRVTLLIDKVQKDINLYQFYQNLNTFKDLLDKKIKLSNNPENDNPVNLSSVYLKHIYIPEKLENHIPIIAKEAKKHKLSSFQQIKINKALDAKINPQSVLGDKVLNRAFGFDQGSSVVGSRLRMLQDRQHNPNDQSQLIENHSIHNSNSQLGRTQIPNESTEHIQPFNEMQSFEIQDSREEN